MQTTTITTDSLHSDVERVYGYNVWEDAAAAAVVELRAGSATGQIVVRIQLASGASDTEVLDKAVFWEFPGGCYVKEDTGSFEGVLYH